MYSLWCKDFINPSFNITTKLWTADSDLKQGGTKKMKALLWPWSLRFNLSTPPLSSLPSYKSMTVKDFRMFPDRSLFLRNELFTSV